ncbi:DUF4349 domain-containing protein [Kroppenstedtia eburnea]|uniref:DUF4349 domain-containing protein n=1 Tax=Kroppenstedtia eburnea TaxID=714067 RepID=UPI00362D0EAF
MWKKWWIWGVSLGLLAGCSSGGAPDQSMNSSVQSKTEFHSLSREGSTESGSGKGTAASDVKKVLNKEGAQVAQEERKVIYRAELRMKVQNLKQAQQAMEAAARKEGGYLVESSQSRAEKEKTGNYVFRIPRESFHTYLERVEKTAQEMESRNITGKDVTEEYVDLESRLKAKKAVEKRLLEMMKGAKTTEDLLKVSEQLSRVQEEIEQLQGRLKYLENQTVYSTVTIHARQVIALEEPEGKPGLGEQISLAFVQSVGWVRDFFQGLLIFGAALLPPAAVAAVIGVPIYIWVRRRKKEDPDPWKPSGNREEEGENPEDR